MDFPSAMVVVASFWLAFYSARNGRPFWASLRDAVIASALFEFVISAASVSFAVSAYWPVIASQLLRIGFLAVATALLGALLARLLGQRRPVTYW
jgi:hypothetical protein